MIDIIAVANQKGGVGKTTTAVALAAESHDRGARTLLLDLDPQGTATAIWGWVPRYPDQPELEGLYGVLHKVIQGHPTSPYKYVAREDSREHLLPATLDLATLELELLGAMRRENVLSDMLSMALLGEYDRIIIDCPPSFGLLTINALTAATRVVIPCVPDYVSVQGLGRLFDTINLVINRKLNPTLIVGGVLVTRQQANTKHHQERTLDIINFCEVVAVPYLGVVANTIKVADASGAGQAVTRYPDANGVGVAYRAVADILYGGN